MVERPVNISPKTWEYLLEELSEPMLVIAAKHPGPALLALDFLHHPELVSGTVIELPNEVEYVITKNGAEQLATDQTKIEVSRLYDRRIEYLDRAVVVAALQSGRVFDQIDG